MAAKWTCALTIQPPEVTGFEEYRRKIRLPAIGD
jgi:hypothetical protein